MRSLLLAATFALVLADPAPADWHRPVPGAVARAFSYGRDPFAAGWHRGVDLASVPGATVRAACSGRVATARPGLVTLRCGRWRVTHLPLGKVSVRRGAVVLAGRAIGTLAGAAAGAGAVGAGAAGAGAVGAGAAGAGAAGAGAAGAGAAGAGASGGGHVGLHLGVRRAGERFGYVDPLPFLRAGTASPPAVAARRIPRSGPPGAGPAPSARRVPRGGPRRAPSPRAGSRRAPPAAAPAPLADPGRGPVPVGVRVFAPATVRGFAPWPAWIGLAVLLLGAVGGGVRIGVRRRRARGRAPLPSAP